MEPIMAVASLAPARPLRGSGDTWTVNTGRRGGGEDTNQFSARRPCTFKMARKSEFDVTSKAGYKT